MLKTRLITGLILAVLALLGIFYLPRTWFALVAAVVIILAAWEWTNMAGLSNITCKIGYCCMMAIGLTICYYLPHSWLLIIGVIWWLISFYIILSYAKKANQLTEKIFWNNTTYKTIIGFFILLPCWVGMLVVRDVTHGEIYFFYLILLISGADTGAYAVGRLFGKNKLIPAVSPGKSWEGFLGAIITGIILALMVALIWRIPFASWGTWFAMSIITVLASVLGDLNESLFKRLRGIKDSGTILPGHGGILDRIDSLTAAVPIFALGLIIYLY